MRNQLAMIFDLDGVLVNTVEAHFTGWAMVADQLGVPFTRDDNDKLRGIPRRDALALLTKNHHLLEKEKEANLLNLKASVYQKEVARTGGSLRVKGVEILLSELRARGIPIGVASSSQHAQMLLDLTDLTALIDVASDGNFRGKLKPEPDQLLYLAQCLNVARAACVVIEDSAVGLEAARRAGMRSIAVGDAALTAASNTQHLNSLAGVRAQDLLGLLEATSSA